ncbi:hypothetical protein R3P38DRAFT_920864 [Favolaschia claudopus]|uniref:F-box domain-containing protein n=1 Tax=Favolaschia claudopus TaxID=2862362 RepID=A0AAW0BNL2_9AGAR
MAEPATLLSLPNELLIIIFENPKFPVDHLATLSLLCRRLHFLALPIYFARSGMPSPTKSAHIHLSKDGHDMLAALTMALFITSMEDITCIFPHPSCTSVLPLIPHLNRFRRFVAKFPSVGRVTLQLDARNSMCNSTGDDAALRAWSSCFGGLLNCLVERRCSELTVRYGGYLTRSYELTVPPGLAKFRVRNVLRAMRALLFRSQSGKELDQTFCRSAEQGKQRGALPAISSKAARSSTLRSLRIQSAVLVMPPSLNWTLSALRSCPITSLTLFQISLELEIWAAALTLIASAAPNLTDLSLSELDAIAAVDILKFCSRLPRLTNLEIGDNLEAAGTPTQCRAGKGSWPEFRHLVSLRAPADFVRHFMLPRTSLRKLTSLCILFYGKTHMSDISVKLLGVGQLMAERRLSPNLTLSLSLYSETMVSDFDEVEELSDYVKQYIVCVGSLTLEVAPFSPVDLARWIRLFPSVQQVCLNFRTKPPDVRSYTKRLLQVVNKDRGYLQTIVVDGKTHVLDSESTVQIIRKTRYYLS